jgi:Secretion system C-terminal sorting domain
MLNLMNTKSKRALLLLVFASCFTISHAQLARLSQRTPASGLGGWLTSNYSICGTGNRDLLIEYNFCGPWPNGPCNISGSCGANPYKIHFRLFRNGNQVANTTYQVSQAWGNWPLYNFVTQPGVYRAEIRLEMKSGFWPFCSWRTLQTTLTNTITVTRQQAVPNFNINGIPIPTDGSPIRVCGSNIRLNAAATTCESNYMISIQESDRWWNRTGQYEVDVWFSGQAPNNINLQQIALTYSQPPTFTGPVNRRNNVLFGGNLPNGQKRYYRVSICVNEPVWSCKTALIEVDGNCRGEVGEPDTNEYFLIGTGGDGYDMANLEYDAVVNGNGDNVNTDEDTEPCTDKIIPGPDPVKEEGKTEQALVIGAPSKDFTSSSSAKLSPNPSQGQVSLVLNPKQETLVRVNIFNAAGNLMKQGLINKKLMPGQQSVSLDISGLKPGVYIVEVQEGKQSSKQKLVINQ